MLIKIIYLVLCMVNLPGIGSFDWRSLLGRSEGVDKVKVEIKKNSQGVDELKGIKVTPVPPKGAPRGMVVLNLSNADVMVKAKELARSIGVDTKAVVTAGKNNAVVSLINDASGVTKEQVKQLQKGTGLSKREARTMAIVTRELADKNSILGAVASPRAKRNTYSIPRTVEKGPDGTVFMHLKTHGRVKSLGQGSFGKVTRSLQIDAKGTPRMVTLKTQKRDIERAQQEGKIIEVINTSKHAGSRFVLHSISSSKYEGKKNIDKYGIVTEFCDKRELSHNKLKKMPESQKWEVFEKILMGVEAVHNAGYVHRDLKPGNILLKSTPSGGLEPRIADFGLSKSKGERCGIGGTDTHIPVDQLLLGRQTRELTDKVDSWSLGIIALQEFANVSIPWLNDEYGEMYMMAVKSAKEGNPAPLEKMKEGLIKSINFKKIKEPNIQKAVKGLLVINSDERMSVTEARELIRLGIDKLKAKESPSRRR